MTRAQTPTESRRSTKQCTSRANTRRAISLIKQSIMPFFSQNRENYVTTLAKLFEYATDNYAKRPLSRFVEGGQEYTFDSFKHKCLELSHRFNRFGISARDKVAIISNNMANL